MCQLWQPGRRPLHRTSDPLLPREMSDRGRIRAQQMTDWPTLLAAVFVAVVGTARLTKLMTEDAFPPVAWLRDRWTETFSASEWSLLVTCPFCVSPYVAAVTVFWGWASDLHWSWWLFYGWLTISYLAGMVVARDIPGPHE